MLNGSWINENGISSPHNVAVTIAIFVAINLDGSYYSENLLDFNSFVRSGQAALHGGNPYDTSTSETTNLNPPLTLFVFQFLAELDPRTTYQIWRLITFSLYILVLILLKRAYPQHTTPFRLVWALCMTGIWYTLLMGQIYVLLLLLCVGAWLSLKSNKPVLAGCMIGLLAAVKPNFIVWPIFMVLGGSWVVATAAFVSFAFLSILPLMAYGTTNYMQWIEILAVNKAAPLATNMSIYGLTSRFHLVGFGLVLAFLLIAATAFLVWRKKPQALEISSLSIVVALLATPFAWVGYAVLLFPIFFSCRWTPSLKVSAILLCAPSIIVFYIGGQSDLAQIAAGLIYFTALVLVLVELARSLLSTSISSHPQAELQPLAK